MGMFEHGGILQGLVVALGDTEEHGFEVEIFNNLEDGFAWLACDNPEPETIKV